MSGLFLPWWLWYDAKCHPYSPLVTPRVVTTSRTGDEECVDALSPVALCRLSPRPVQRLPLAWCRGRGLTAQSLRPPVLPGGPSGPPGNQRRTLGCHLA